MLVSSILSIATCSRFAHDSELRFYAKHRHAVGNVARLGRAYLQSTIQPRGFINHSS